MATYIINGTIAANNTAEDILPANNNFIAVVIQAIGADLRVNVDANASASAGETIFADTSATFTNLTGKRISAYGAMGTAYSIRTGA